MKVDAYRQDMTVRKHANMPFMRRHPHSHKDPTLAGKIRVGIAISPTPFTTPRAQGKFCMVLWEGSTRPEEVALTVLSEYIPEQEVKAA